MPPKFIDVTLPISAHLAVWPGDPPVEIVWPDEALPAFARLSLGNHTGTHVDAPAHFVRGGATAEALALETLIGPAWVVHLPGVAAVTAATLEAAAIPPGVPRLLIRTDNSARAKIAPAPPPHLSGAGAGAAPPAAPGGTGRPVADPAPAAFDPDYVALAPDAADWLLARRVRLVGVDGPSVDPFAASDFPVHRALLAADVVLIERLALAQAAPGVYELICLPLPLVGCDGAPARVILVSCAGDGDDG